MRLNADDVARTVRPVRKQAFVNFPVYQPVCMITLDCTLYTAVQKSIPTTELDSEMRSLLLFVIFPENATSVARFARDGRVSSSALPPLLVGAFQRHRRTTDSVAGDQPRLVGQITAGTARSEVGWILGERQVGRDEFRGPSTRSRGWESGSAPRAIARLGIQLLALCHQLGVYRTRRSVR